MTGFRLSDRSNVRCGIAGSFEVIAEAFGDEQLRGGFGNSGRSKV